MFLADKHAVHHVAEVADIIYGAGALLRFLPPYSPNFNPITGTASIKQKSSFGKMMSPIAVAHNPVLLSCMLSGKFLTLMKIAKVTIETVATCNVVKLYTETNGLIKYNQGQREVRAIKVSVLS